MQVLTNHSSGRLLPVLHGTQFVYCATETNCLQWNKVRSEALCEWESEKNLPPERGRIILKQEWKVCTCVILQAKDRQIPHRPVLQCFKYNLKQTYYIKEKTQMSGTQMSFQSGKHHPWTQNEILQYKYIHLNLRGRFFKVWDSIYYI